MRSSWFHSARILFCTPCSWTRTVCTTRRVPMRPPPFHIVDNARRLRQKIAPRRTLHTPFRPTHSQQDIECTNRPDTQSSQLDMWRTLTPLPGTTCHRCSFRIPMFLRAKTSLPDTTSIWRQRSRSPLHTHCTCLHRCTVCIQLCSSHSWLPLRMNNCRSDRQCIQSHPSARTCLLDSANRSFRPDRNPRHTCCSCLPHCTSNSLGHRACTAMHRRVRTCHSRTVCNLRLRSASMPLLDMIDTLLSPPPRMSLPYSGYMQSRSARILLRTRYTKW
jgi:hypothetical protein